MVGKKPAGSASHNHESSIKIVAVEKEAQAGLMHDTRFRKRGCFAVARSVCCWNGSPQSTTALLASVSDRMGDDLAAWRVQPPSAIQTQVWFVFFATFEMVLLYQIIPFLTTTHC
jgi:hypothetical protein